MLKKFFRPDFKSACSRSSCCSPKCPQKRDFLDIYLITSFGVHIFRNTSAMRVFSFWKNFKITCTFQKWTKKLDKNSYFSYNCFSIGFVKLFLLRREYLSRAVIALTNTFETSHISKRDLSQPNCLHNDQWISQRWCPLVFKSACSLHHAGRRSVLWNRIF